MIHEIFPVGPLACNCSILADETSLRATVIDPGADITKILAVLQQHHLTVEQIIITHAHIDHVGGAVQLKRLTGAPIYMNQNDLPLLKMMDMQAGWLGVPAPEVAAPDVDASDLLPLTIAGEPAQVLHTPGHTEGSICLHLPRPHLLLAGDTLFAGLDRSHRPARRRSSQNSAVIERTLVNAAGCNPSHPRPRTRNHHRRRARNESIPHQFLALSTASARSLPIS